MAVPTRSELDARIRERVGQDPDFRRLLVTDPRAALLELFDLRIPEGITVTVHEESLTDVHLVLPTPFDAQLAEEDLDLVAGGLHGPEVNVLPCGFPDG